jgi:hypothetical protein
MDAPAIALVIGAALCHALWNLAAKSAGGDARFALFCGGLVGLLWLPLAGWLAVDELSRWGPLAWTLVAASAVVHVSCFLTLLRGYRATG